MSVTETERLAKMLSEDDDKWRELFRYVVLEARKAGAWLELLQTLEEVTKISSDSLTGMLDGDALLPNHNERHQIITLSTGFLAGVKAAKSEG